MIAYARWFRQLELQTAHERKGKTRYQLLLIVN